MSRKRWHKAVWVFAVLGAVLLLAFPGAVFALNADNATQIRNLYFSSHNANNQIQGAGYSYDANGNAASYRGYSFGYDYEDLPESVTTVSTTFLMGFRSDGLRAWRGPSNDCDYFLYDGDRVVCEFKADGTTSWYYNYGPNGLAMKSSAPTTYYVYSFDHLGSLVQPFYSGTAGGLAQKTIVYDAFGKLWWDQLASNGVLFSGIFQPAGFAGQWGAYADQETRLSGENTPLVLMGIRYYDPITARFVSRDPALGINDYAYWGNNPVGRIDPDGQLLETVLDVASIGWSTYDLIKNPSWANAGYLAWDIGATVVPFVPGSYAAKGAKMASKGLKAAKGVKSAKALTKGVHVAAGGNKPIAKAYHYTTSTNADKIMAKRSRGLKSSSGVIYSTPNKGLSPLQAQIDLALPPNRGLSNAILEIDLDGLRQAGFDVGDPRTVGRSFGMPGGGQEILIRSKSMPKRFLRRVR